MRMIMNETEWPFIRNNEQAMYVYDGNFAHIWDFPQHKVLSLSVNVNDKVDIERFHRSI